RRAPRRRTSAGGDAAGSHDQGEPVAVAGVAAVHHVVEGVLDGLGHRALAAADVPVVDRGDPHDPGGGVAQEQLVGRVQLGAHDVAAPYRDAEVGGEPLHGVPDDVGVAA